MATYPHDDGELFRRCKDERDEDAWAALVRRYADLVYSVPFRSFQLDREDCADVFQETFQALLENLDEIEGVHGLATWLYKAARHRCLNLVRRRKYDDELGRRVDEQAALRRTSEISLEKHVLGLELRSALDELGEPCRTILHGRYYEDPPVTYQELARRLGMSVGSIGPTRARCLEKLLLYLQPNRDTD